MIIRPFSDLHLEFDDSFVPKELDSDGDTVLVLAGDIHIGTKAIPWISQFNERFKAVVYVLGNHEYYKHSFANLVSKMKTKVSELELNNVYVLEKETKIIDDVAFIGTTLWTSFDNCDQLAMYNAGLWMNDYKKIRNGEGNPYQRKLKPVETAAAHQRACEFIEKELKKDYDRRIIVTHHVPSYNFINKDSDMPSLDHAFASNLDDLISDNDIDIWLFGHSHNVRVEEHANTLFVQNCRGYYGVETVKDFKDGLIIEI